MTTLDDPRPVILSQALCHVIAPRSGKDLYCASKLRGDWVVVEQIIVTSHFAMRVAA
jgi:hypothetical protein